MSLLAKARAIIAELPVAEVRLASFQHVCPVDIAENAARLEYEEGLTRDEADRRALGARGYSSWPALADTHPERICGQRVTWKSRREQPLQRLIRRANKIALKLDCDSWMEQPIARPPHMRLETFERLKSERAPLVAQINQRIAIRLARSRRGNFGAFVMLAKLGL